MPEWNDLFKEIKVEEPELRLTEFEKKSLLPGMRVLDIGCGTGRHSLYLSLRHMDTYAIDISEYALSCLKEKAKKQRLDVKTQKAGFDVLPFSDEYFDAVISVHVHNHGLYKELESAFWEIKRVLKPKGYLFLVVTPESMLEKFMLTSSRKIEQNTYVGLDLYDGEIPHHFFSEKEIMNIFSSFERINLIKYQEDSQWTAKGVIEKMLYIGQKYPV